MKVSGNHNLIPNEDWNIVNLEEVRIDVNASVVPCVIQLPSTSENNGQNVKLFVNYDIDMVSTKSITILAAEGELINNQASFVLTPDLTGVWIQIQDDGHWGTSSSPSPQQSPTTTVNQLRAYIQQSGTNAPVLVQISGDWTGTDFQYFRNDVGKYMLLSPGGWFNGKSLGLQLQSTTPTGSTDCRSIAQIRRVGQNTIEISTYKDSGAGLVAADSELAESYLVMDVFTD